jgi:glucokinase
MFLAGDLGGTKSNLALFERRGGKLVRVSQKRHSSSGYARPEDLIAEFAVSAGAKIEAACFAVAGPVKGGVVRVTNLPWVVEGAAIARLLGLERVLLLNDLEASGYGLAELEAKDLVTLNEGTNVREANQALIAAGTGLGEAILVWDGARFIPVGTEGGHADFAPRNAQEIELLKFLLGKFPRVSWETVLSGRGFALLHEFLEPGARHPSFDNPAADPAPEITAHALKKSCAACVRTLELWVELYGAEAGNLALKSLALGGVYVAGGVAVKILEKLKEGGFARAFREKAAHTELLAQIPIRVVLDEDLPLLGAAARAAAQLS